MSDPSIMTIEEVADLLRIKSRSIYRKVKMKTIPGAFNLDPNSSRGRIRFVKEDVLGWIHEQVQSNEVK